MHLLSSCRLPIDLSVLDLEALSFPSLPGSRLLGYENEDIRLRIKEVVSRLYTIRFSSFRLKKEQALEFVFPGRGLHARVMLQNSLGGNGQGTGSGWQQEDTVSVMWAEMLPCRALFASSGEYQTLDVFFSSELLDQVSPLLPELFSRSMAVYRGGRAPQPVFVRPALREVIRQLLNGTYDAGTASFYYDLKIREYLYLLLRDSGGAANGLPLTPFEKEQLVKARDLLLQRLEMPPPSIGGMAWQLGLSENRLRTGFRALFGLGIFEYFYQARMERARDLLLTTNLPMKSICSRAGYPRLTNFITAFRKHFGYTPGSVRRR